MQKIPKKYAGFVFAFVMSLLMALLMSGVLTAVFTGFKSDFLVIGGTRLFTRGQLRFRRFLSSHL